MRHNKHCSRSRRPGGAPRKGFCERQEAIKVHSAAAGSAQIQHSPPITRGGGGGEKGRQPAVPTQCPTPGAIRAGACESAGRRGSPQLPGQPRRRGLAPPPLSACGRTPRRTRTGSPTRGSRPRGRRAGPWSDRRGRDRPRSQPPALLSPRPLPGEGAVGQAWPLSPPRGEGPPPLRQPRDPYPAARLPTAEPHRRAGDMGGAPPPSSAVSSRDSVVPLPPAPRSLVSPGPQILALPGARPPCLTRGAGGSPLVPRCPPGHQPAL